MAGARRPERAVRDLRTLTSPGVDVVEAEVHGIDVAALKREADGAWTITITLVPGTYPYLFVVDGVPWNDPLDDGRAPSEWGGEYSVRRVR